MPLIKFRAESSSVSQVVFNLSWWLLLVSLWALNHRYAGIAKDADLYAFQALAKLHTNLSTDVYLASRSQDDYTLFSSLYGWLIAQFGLLDAAAGLFLFCTALYLVAAHIFSRALSNVKASWLTLGLLVITPGKYGAFDVFSYTDDFLTARSLAVALVVVALACYFHRRFWQAMSAAALAMLVHPLMALPGALLIICMALPTWTVAWSAAAVCLSALATAILIPRIPALNTLVMDPAWLYIVRERSQFLFLNLWRANDWDLAARPFVSLTLTALVIDERRVRKLCAASMLLGLSGLIVAGIAGSIGPVALLVQGQAWRWIWLTSFVAVVLLAPTVSVIVRDRPCGPICAVLLLAGWTWHQDGAVGLLFTEFALGIWMLRSRFADDLSRPLAGLAIAGGVLLTAGTAVVAWQAASPRPPGIESAAFMAGRLSEVFSGLSSVAIVVIAQSLLLSQRSTIARTIIFVTLLSSTIFFVPAALRQSAWGVQVPTDRDEFDNWRGLITPNSNTLLLPVPVNASFIWCTLNRPSYLSLDQSSGVVFSRQTALEIRRRSEVLLPLAEPDWKIMTHLINKKRGETAPVPGKLTTKILTEICEDEQLGFVISKEDVGLSSSTQTSGTWKDWNLYDCGKVRSNSNSK